MTVERSVLESQLREGNAGAQGYFEGRVKIYLATGDDHSLAAFMRGFWHHYKAGVEDLWKRAKARSTS